MKDSNRRQFLKLGVGSIAGGLAAAGLMKGALGQDSCVLTPPQTMGPFYPGETKFDQDVDLTRVPGKSGRAQGQVVYIKGVVLDHLCRPISGANVEIWQACASGRYNNSKDPNPAPLDPNFKYWAETFTNDKGEYVFKTVIPGAYPAARDWDRPPHVHFKVTKLGYRELVTQMYFKGEALNDRDLILQDLPPVERDSVIVEFRPATPDLEPGSLVGSFEITLRPVRR